MLQGVTEIGESVWGHFFIFYQYRLMTNPLSGTATNLGCGCYIWDLSGLCHVLTCQRQIIGTLKGIVTPAT